jgi:hypothetical protein
MGNDFWSANAGVSKNAARRRLALPFHAPCQWRHNEFEFEDEDEKD